MRTHNVVKACIIIILVALISTAVSFGTETSNTDEQTPATVGTLGSVSLDKTTYTYDGYAHKPVVTVVDSAGNVLALDTDYTVSYRNNISVGNATVMVTGKGNYTGTLTTTFAIIRPALGTIIVDTPLSDLVYDGTAKRPSVIVYNASGDVLRISTEYTLDYANNVNAGTATVTVTGRGSYSSDIKRTTFLIRAASISTLTIGTTSYTYDGSAKTPSVVVKSSTGKTLTANTDYTVSYKNNTNAGQATVTVTGNGNYTGALTKQFVINPATLYRMKVSPLSMVYSGEPLCPYIAVYTNRGDTLKPGIDYTVSYEDNILPGSAVATATGKGNYTGTLSMSFTIEKKPQPWSIKISKKTVKATTLKKKAKSIRPIRVTGAVGDVSYKKSSGSANLKIDSESGKVTVKKKTKAGTYKMRVKIRATGDDEYKTMSKTITVLITVR